MAKHAIQIQLTDPSDPADPSAFDESKRFWKLALFDKDGNPVAVDTGLGIAGPPGVKGDKGDQGNVGPGGVQGNAGPAGADGAPGTPGGIGPAGANGTGFRWRGPYLPASAATYLTDDVVSSGGASFIALVDSPVSAPADNAEWDPITIAGPPGPQGNDGQPGPRGLAGTDGTDGAQGIQGAKGDQGPKGDKGDQGIQGIPGAAGAKGDTGDPGPSGSSGGGSLVGAKLRKAAAWNVPNLDGLVTFDTKDYDLASGFAGASAPWDHLTAPDDGLYFVSAHVTFANVNDGQRRRIEVFVTPIAGGAAYSVAQAEVGAIGAIGFPTPTICEPIQLAAGDQVRLHTYTDAGGGTLTAYAGLNHFALTAISVDSSSTGSTPPADPSVGLISANRALVTATASSQHSSGLYNAPNAKDGNAGTFWSSAPDVNPSWLQIDLGANRYGQIDYWSLLTRGDVAAHHPRTFKLQGSIDGATWTDLDVHTDDVTINAAGTWYSFPVVGPTAMQGYRYFRFQQTKNNDEGSTPATAISANLAEIELQGQMVP